MRSIGGVWEGFSSHILRDDYDRDDPSDRAFDLTINRGFCQVDALKYTNAPISYQGLKRHKVNVQRQDK